MQQPSSVFIIYAREDEQFLKKLLNHLRPLENAGRILVWSDRAINPGELWEEKIREALSAAQLILVLVSDAYFGSAYIHEVEIKRAIERQKKGEAKVLPIIVRACFYEDDPTIGDLQALPKDAVPVNEWPSQDNAWKNVVGGLKRILDEFEKEKVQHIEQTAWQEAADAHTIAAYHYYLRNHQNGRYAHEAHARIRRLQKQESPPLLWGRYARLGGGSLVLLLAGWLLWRIGPWSAMTSADIPGMVLVRGGGFEMGDQFGDGDSNEKPVHTVALKDFYMSRTEVTIGEFRDFVEATGYQTDAEKIGSSWVVQQHGDWQEKLGINWRHNEEGAPSTVDSYPVLHISWHDAVAYCNWLSERQGLQYVYTIRGSTVTADWSANGYRLPTEAEWEYAASSGGGREKFAGFNDEKQLYRYANFCDINCDFDWKTQKQNDGFRCSAPVGSFEPNGLGLHDMTGNVWEWCWDWYGDYSAVAQTNPSGPNGGSGRVLRGGSWYDLPAVVRVARRNSGASLRRGGDYGFRLVRSSL